MTHGKIVAGETMLLRTKDYGDLSVALQLPLDQGSQVRERDHRLFRLPIGPCSVPITSVQSATASPRHSVVFAFCSKSGAPTADRASRQCGAKGATTVSREKPKLAMARAPAPILRGLRGDTSTTPMRSSWVAVSKQSL